MPLFQIISDCGPTGVPFSTLLGTSKFEEGAFISCITGYTGGGAATCNAFGIWEVLPLCNPKGKSYFFAC